MYVVSSFTILLIATNTGRAFEARVLDDADTDIISNFYTGDFGTHFSNCSDQLMAWNHWVD